MMGKLWSRVRVGLPALRNSEHPHP
jgi:hypothetical protein